MKEQIRIQTATGKKEERGKCERVIKIKRKYDKMKNGKESRREKEGEFWADVKRENGWAKEVEQLCRSKWLGLIRH